MKEPGWENNMMASSHDNSGKQSETTQSSIGVLTLKLRLCPKTATQPSF